MWYLYIIRCADSSLYTGITTDVERRFNEHADQGRLAAKYLRGKTPLTLVFTVEARTRSEVSTLEFRVKKLAKADKELVVSGDKSLTDLGLV